jgi:hypothetical protein
MITDATFYTDDFKFNSAGGEYRTFEQVANLDTAQLLAQLTKNSTRAKPARIELYNPATGGSITLKLSSFGPGKHPSLGDCMTVTFDNNEPKPQNRFKVIFHIRYSDWGC